VSCEKQLNGSRCSLEYDSSGSREHVLHGDVDAPMRRGIFGACGRLNILMIYMPYDGFLCKELAFGDDDCTCVKISIGINFSKLQLIP